MAEDSQFIDKSRALYDFLQMKTPVHLLLRPRRSGKSTLLTMFRAFFERTSPAENKSRKELFLKKKKLYSDYEGGRREGRCIKKYVSIVIILSFH